VRIVLAVASLLTCSATDTLATDGTKQVLVLYSTTRDSILGGAGDRDLSRLLDDGLSHRLDYYNEYIDLARFSDPQYQAGFREFLRFKYRAQHFDVVIAVEEGSLEFVNKHRDALFPGVPVVFFALDPATRRMTNSTGVLAELGLGRTLTLAAALQPETQQVFVVSGASARDRFYEGLARQQLLSLDPRVTITYLAGLPARELEERVSALPPHSIIFFLRMSQDGAGVNVKPLPYLERLATLANRPIYSWDDSTMGHGVVGGSLRHLESGVSVLAQQALKVLRGQEADSIAIAAPELSMIQIDWRQLERWHIEERRVPAGVVVKFRELTIWTRYRSYILAALVLLLAQSALIAGLFVQRARRRQAEAQLRGSEAELRTSYSRIRALSRRLLDAQEVERARIARELHHDISRPLAHLAADLKLARGFSQDRRQHGEELAGLALECAQTVARKVHELSHRLHPSKLRLIGLVAALSGLQRELSRNGIEITFTHDNVPAALPQDLASCLFRVVQEGLQNAVTHSAARTVSVHLTGRDRMLALTIVDNGHGFDVGSVWGKGLGLVSMRERLEAIGGTLTIHSRPGAGTRLEVAVPLREAGAVETVA